VSVPFRGKHRQDWPLGEFWDLTAVFRLIRVFKAAQKINRIAATREAILDIDYELSANYLAVNKRGDVFFVDDRSKIRKIDNDLIVKTIPGTTNYDRPEHVIKTDGNIKHLTQLIPFENDDTVLFYLTSKSKTAVKEHNVEDVSTLVAGGGKAYCTGKMRATDVALKSIVNIRFSPNNELFIASRDRIYKVDKNGMIDLVAGQSNCEQSELGWKSGMRWQ
jgi:hypothetical protein